MDVFGDRVTTLRLAQENRGVAPTGDELRGTEDRLTPALSREGRGGKGGHMQCAATGDGAFSINRTASFVVLRACEFMLLLRRLGVQIARYCDVRSA